MKTKSAILIFFIVIFCQCMHVEKRRYLKGFYVERNSLFNQKKGHNISECAGNSEKQKTDTLNNENGYNKTEIERLSSPDEEKVYHTDKPESDVGEQETSEKPVGLISQKKKQYLKVDPLGGFRSKKFKGTNERDRMNLSAYFYFIPFLGVFFLFKRSRKSRIGEWATTNQTRARWLIAVLNVLAGLFAYLLGEISLRSGIYITGFSHGIYAVVILIPALIYYGAKKRKSTFNFKRFGIFLMGVSGSFGAFMLGRKSVLLNSTAFFSFSAASGFSSTDSLTPNPLVMHPALAVILSLIILFLLVVLFFFLANLACSLACSGSMLLAGLVFYGGNFLGITLGVLALLHIWKKKKSAYPDERTRNLAFIRSAIVTGLIAVAAFAIALLGL